MTEDEITRFVGDLPGVVTMTASKDNGAPEVSWGDSFFYYDPDDRIPADRRIPFATLVVHDYDGFDTASRLDRPGVFRLNIAVGRARFEELLGYPPAEHANRAADVDYSVLDRLIPHPLYAAQGYVSMLCPGTETSAEARELITLAHRRAADRYR